jgi:hypothetical protein
MPVVIRSQHFELNAAISLAAQQSSRWSETKGKPLIDLVDDQAIWTQKRIWSLGMKFSWLSVAAIGAIAGPAARAELYQSSRSRAGI